MSERWYVFDEQSKHKHAVSAEFSGIGFRWGVSQFKNPISPMFVQPVESKADAEKLVAHMNAARHDR